MFEFDALAMNILKLINYLLDLAEYICSTKNLGYPETYIESFKILRKFGIINDYEYKIFSKLVKIRNSIAHEYHEVYEKKI